MWLLDVETRKLVYFMDDRQVEGKYAILSHTWDTEEVTFADIHKPEARGMKGYKKIEYTCKQAEQDGLKYAWIDTCAINKDSSAELSEAINSMFRWYQMLAVCYVYFADAVVTEFFSEYARQEYLVSLLASCRWFTRGWTLQEMIASTNLKLYDANWANIGLLGPGTESMMMVMAFSEITGVPVPLLEDSEALDSYSLAQRLSWAARRKTTRLEDAAYSLLGLLDINMPLLYGEGGKAFTRLQEELLRTSTDRSLLLWQPHCLDQIHMLLAPDPLCFRNVGGSWKPLMRDDITTLQYESDKILTNRGLRIFLPTGRCTNPQYRWAYLGEKHGIGDVSTAILLRQTAPAAPRLEDVQGPATSLTFEIVRAAIPSLGAHEFDKLDEKLEWIELLIDRNARSDMFVLDMDHGIECNDDADFSRPGGITEFVPRNKTEQYLSFVRPAAVRPAAVRPAAVWKDTLSIWRYNPHPETYQLAWARPRPAYARIPGTESILRFRLWLATSFDLPDNCKLNSNLFILRIWISAAEEEKHVMLQQSKPTDDVMLRLWKVEWPISGAT